MQLTDDEFEQFFSKIPDNLKDLPLWKDKELYHLLCDICSQDGICPSVIDDLMEWERESIGAGRRNGLNEIFSKLLNEPIYWSEE